MINKSQRAAYMIRSSNCIISTQLNLTYYACSLMNTTNYSFKKNSSVAKTIDEIYRM